MVFNGEIYNHRASAPRSGEGAGPWRGHSDSEVLLEAIARWGFVATLRTAERHVRDRRVGPTGAAALAGARPVRREAALLRLERRRIAVRVGAEGAGAAPGFANDVDRDVLALYLRHNTVPAPWSILKDVFKLEPGAILTLDRRALDARPEAAPRAPIDAPGISCRHYWSLEQLVRAGPDRLLGAEEAITALETRLTEAVRLQMVADVPVGALLLGGVIDSSTVVALMRRSAGADGTGPSPSAPARPASTRPVSPRRGRHLGTDHTELYVSAPGCAARSSPSFPAFTTSPSPIRRRSRPFVSATRARKGDGRVVGRRRATSCSAATTAIARGAYAGSCALSRRRCARCWARR